MLPPQSSKTITATYDPPNIPGSIENCAYWTAVDVTGASTAAAEDCAMTTITVPTDVALTVLAGDRVGCFSLFLGGLVVLSLLAGGFVSVWRRMRSKRRPWP